MSVRDEGSAGREESGNGGLTFKEIKQQKPRGEWKKERKQKKTKRL